MTKPLNDSWSQNSSSEVDQVKPTSSPYNRRTMMRWGLPLGAGAILGMSVPKLLSETSNVESTKSGMKGWPSDHPYEFYVAPSGNDGNSGSSPDSALKSIQLAVDRLHKTGGGVVHLGGGIFEEEITLKHRVSILGLGKRITYIKAVAGSKRPGAVQLDRGPVGDISFQDLTVMASENSGQHGILLESSASQHPPFHGGLWYAQFSRISVQGFSGHQFWLNGGGTDYQNPHQFVQLNDVEAFAVGGNRALLMSGQVGQVNVIGGHFDGPMKNNPGINVELRRECDLEENNLSNLAPYSINFFGTTIQKNSMGILIEKASPVSLNGCHFEKLERAVTATRAASSTTVTSCDFQDSSTDSLGNGYIVSAGVDSVIYSFYNFITGKSDKTHLLSSPTAFIAWEHNIVTSELASKKSIDSNRTTELKLGNINTIDVSTKETIVSIVSSLAVGEVLYLRAVGTDVSFRQSDALNVASPSNTYTLQDGAISAWIHFPLSPFWNRID